MSGPFIIGVQPVLEAIASKAQVRVVYLARGRAKASEKIRSAASRARVRVEELPRGALDRKARTKNHQGVVAELEADARPAFVEPEAILDRAAELQEEPLVVVLDGIQDPRNFGALIRTSHALGAHGIVFSERRAAQVSETVIKTSAGAFAHIALSRVTNIKRALDVFEQAGLRSVATALDGDPLASSDLGGPLAVVIGAEDKGVKRTVAEHCDVRVRIELFRGFDSLNVSVAAGVVLYEISRQRRI